MNPGETGNMAATRWLADLATLQNLNQASGLRHSLSAGGTGRIEFDGPGQPSLACFGSLYR